LTEVGVFVAVVLVSVGVGWWLGLRLLGRMAGDATPEVQGQKRPRFAVAALALLVIASALAAVIASGNVLIALVFLLVVAACGGLVIPLAHIRSARRR